MVVAIAAASGLVLSGPYIGLLRSSLKRAIPGRFGLIVNVVIALAIGAAIVVALRGIRERRAVRYAALAGALALGATYAHFFIHGSADTITVERFHFVEYGIITFLFYRVWRGRADASAFVLPALAGLFIGTLDEGLQFYVPDRIGELNDLQLNAAAIACGLLFSVAAVPPARGDAAWRRESARPVGVLAALTTAALALFIAAVHLGFDVRDPAIGAFKSRYSAGQLLQLSDDRQAHGFRLPAQAPRFSREDQYLVEALWHAQRRNELWAADRGASWSENLILERYFAPALSLPGLRWPAAQRDAAAARASASPFVSTANRLTIYTWSRPVFWTISAAVVVLCLLFSLLVGRRAAELQDLPKALR